MVHFVRTPDQRFDNLFNFPFEPKYVTLPSSKDLRLAYIDEQTPNYDDSASKVFLCLHGVPTYSYLYRHIIPVLLHSNKSHNNGVRVICPDFIGFGRSDKPTNESSTIHNLRFHQTSMIELIKYLNLSNITLIVQDWGGLIGLTLPMHIASIDRIILFNTTIPDGSPISNGFMDWRKYATNPSKNIDCGRVVHSSCLDKEKGAKYGGLTAEERRAYNAPFVDETYKCALRKFPSMVAINAFDDGMDIWRKTLLFWQTNKRKNESNQSKIKIFMAHGCRDVVFEYDVIFKLFHNLISDEYNACFGTTMEIGAILWVPNAAHFIQESKSICWIIGKALKYFGDIPYDSVEYEWILSMDKNKKYCARILKIVLNYNKVHPLAPCVIDGLNQIFDYAEDNDYCAGVILTAFNKQRLLLNERSIFCAGLDLKTFQKNNEKLAKKYTFSVRELWKRQHLFCKPMICALNGNAIAGGALLALACDYRIGYKETKIQMLEAQIGLGASQSVVAQIVRVTGSSDKAGFVLQTAVPFCGQSALEYNLLSEIVDDEDTSHGSYDEQLMRACVDVLENKYFNGQHFAAASAKRHCRQSVIDIFDKELKDLQSGKYEKTKGGFLSSNVQKYINQTIKSKL